MSIDFDTSSSGNAISTSLTYSHTCNGGVNQLLLVAFRNDTDASSNKVSSVTYGGVAMTLLSSQVYNASGTLYFYYLLGPANGANNIIITRTDSFLIDAYSASYIAVKQTGFPDNHVENNGTANPNINFSLTTVADHCWVAVAALHPNGTLTITSGGTVRVGTTTIFGDTNGEVTPAGSKTFTIHDSVNETVFINMVSFAPLVLTGTDISGAAVESFSITTSVAVTGTEVSGTPVENSKIRYGFGNQSKSTDTWNNIQKS